MIVQTPSEPHKLLGLEALRFIAAMSVLLWHYQHFACVSDMPVDFARSGLPFYAVLFPFYEAGETGVAVFWCISGLIFFWKYGSVIATRAIDSWTFFVYRLSRLYPLHLATLLLVTALQAIYFANHGFFFVYQTNDAFHFGLQLFLASEWLPSSGLSFNGPVWSVSVEVLVYAAFFLTLRYLRASPLVNVIVILVAAASGTLIGRCVVYFYTGGLVAMAMQALADHPHRLKLELSAGCAAVALPLSLWLAGLAIAPIAAPLTLICTPLLVFCCSGPLPLPRRVERLLEATGNMTYACYLLHFPIQLAIMLVFAALRRPIPYHDALFWLAFLALTLTAAHLTYRHFEAPAQRLIRRALLQKQQTGRIAPAPLSHS
ncbi:acyltransferase family protein [Bradyrhizobium sp. HKCCYLS20291]|uniref:acyltransferase family protein n=1 Tax=Bradyrhizobium sp. HKCCYLS20291 TaxID=3420766 RepID=UPI003EBE0E5C